ncbi:MAG: hypothetical protein IBJ03_15790 [Gemmatimonadaceae bacterium]|nr:hypothetical protein [Gemmatimonadaceae bacterium]
MALPQLKTPGRVALVLLILALVAHLVGWYVTGSAPRWRDLIALISLMALLVAVATRHARGTSPGSTSRGVEYCVLLSVLLVVGGQMIPLLTE